MTSRKCHDVLPDPVLSQLSDFVAARMGLHFPRDRWADLERGMRAASVECGVQDAVTYAQGLFSPAASRKYIEKLASHLTVGETHFFREKRSLEIVEEHIIPELERRRLRIWSAGCASGEEPYSIAILLSRVIPGRNAAILATDLNTSSLRKASQGIYGEWSFRGTPQWIRGRYFSATSDGHWAIDASIKKMVTFSCANLVDDIAADQVSTMDIVFCRNVLMYFHPESAKKAVRNIYRSLAPGGWLIVSPVETSHRLFTDFTQVSFDGATFYRKPKVDQKGTTSPTIVIKEPVLDRYEDAVSPVPDNRDHTPGMLRLARACANQGKLREAFRWCEKAIATGKADSRAHYLRAVILEEQGCFEEAVRSLRRALYLDPKFAIVHFALGNLAAKRGSLKESIKHFENTLEVLGPYEQDDILPDSGGLTAGRLRELVARRVNG